MTLIREEEVLFNGNIAE